MARSYTTVQSDTWDSIAYRLWGEERRLHILLDANPDYADTLVFPVGTVLVVPDVPTITTKTTELPPWI